MGNIGDIRARARVVVALHQGFDEVAEEVRDGVVFLKLGRDDPVVLDGQ